MSSPQTPIIIGVGDIVNRSLKVDDAYEPATLMLEAINAALKDAVPMTKLGNLASSIDSIDVVACWTWPYDNLPGLLANKLKVHLVHQFQPSTHGGNQPALLLDNAARRVSSGKAKVAVVCGGEALASLTACVKEGKVPPPGWTKTSTSIESVFSATTRELETGLGRAHRIGAPIQIYPLYENGLRAHRGQSISENMSESAQLYADFADIAVNHPYAWNYQRVPATAPYIGTPSQQNRMICWPYTLLMNAFNTVNLAAACVVTTVQHATELGVPQEKWIFPLGGAGTRDSYEFWNRPNYHSSPSINQSLDAALEVSGLRKEDIDVFDFYSCFPIVPKLACQHLGISVSRPQKPITLLGGLTSFGGAGNNYSMHAVTEMVRELRTGRYKTGLVLANGGWLTYQHAICLSRESRQCSSIYPEVNPLPEVLTNESAPIVDEDVEGEAVIETYTVDFDRKNTPVRGQIIGRLVRNGHRFIANHADKETLKQLVDEEIEPIGRRGFVRTHYGQISRNLFSLYDHGLSKL